MIYSLLLGLAGCLSHNCCLCVTGLQKSNFVFFLSSSSFVYLILEVIIFHKHKHVPGKLNRVKHAMPVKQGRE